MPAVKRFESCARCRKDKDGLVQLKNLFEDTITTSSDLIAYLRYNRSANDSATPEIKAFVYSFKFAMSH